MVKMSQKPSFQVENKNLSSTNLSPIWTLLFRNPNPRVNKGEYKTFEKGNVNVDKIASSFHPQ